MTDWRALCAEMFDYWDNDCPVTLAEVMERARAALSQPEPEPSDGEKAELVQAVRHAALNDEWGNYRTLTRAADLLERLSPPQPIPVSERLPCLEDCDAEGRCWFHSVGRTWKDWYLLRAASATETETHWLPAHALPLPS